MHRRGLLSTTAYRNVGKGMQESIVREAKTFNAMHVVMETLRRAIRVRRRRSRGEAAQETKAAEEPPAVDSEDAEEHP